MRPAVLLHRLASALTFTALTALAACHRPMVTAGTPAVPAATGADAGADPAFRRPGPRGSQTIFSALDLPAPSRVRTAAGRPGPDYWQQRADYVIEATLDAATHTIDGRERITYTNNSPESLPFLWIHLEQNAFNDTSINSRIAGPEDRFGSHGAFHGGVEVKYVRLVRKTDRERAIGQPGPGVIDLPFHVYDTVARIGLPEPMPAAAAGAPSQAQLEIGWSFKVPPYGADRMGIYESGAGGPAGEVFQVAQWFPAIAVFDDVHGWNTLPYVGQGEFYTNIGAYDVSITVPREHLVAGSGVLQNPTEVLTAAQIERLEQAEKSKETVVIRSETEVADPTSRPAGPATFTWRFKADNVRTFAWSSSAAFIWDAAACDIGPGPAWAGERPVLAMSMYTADALPLWAGATQMLQSSIEHYSARWFKYPYPVATNINGVVGGMEYPMVIFCSEREDERGLFGVTTHEIGHNWFPMTVNTDERRHAWMDEGFNTFMNYYACRERYEDDAERRGDADAYVGAMRQCEQQPMEIPADQVRPGTLGNLQYAKPATALVVLREQVLGAERFDAAFRQYIADWAFKSPRPADFFRAMENAAGEDLAWFWRGWFLETGAHDQAIEKVEFDAKAGSATATLVNRAELVMPVMFRVSYDDGTTEDRRLPVQVWYWTNRWTTTWETGGRRPVEVTIDPDHAVPDVERGNNVWTAK